MVRVKTRISNSAKLPLSVVRGNVQQRQNLAQKYSDMFVENLNKESNLDFCSFNKIINALNRTIAPNQTSIKLSNKIENRFAASVVAQYSETSKLDDVVLTATGYKFFRKNATPKKENIPKAVAIHEVRHIIDHLVNPKTTIYRFRGIEKENICNVGKNIYYRFLETFDSSLKTKDFEQSIREELSKIPPETRIDRLQKVRYSLITEMNAYKDELKFLIKSPIKNFNTILGLTDFLLFDINFNSKLKLATKLLREELCAYRKEIASSKKRPNPLSN